MNKLKVTGHVRDLVNGKFQKGGMSEELISKIEEIPDDVTLSRVWCGLEELETEAVCTSTDLKSLVQELKDAKRANRYALATLRTMEAKHVFEDSDFGLLIAEAVKKLESVVEDGEALAKGD